MHNSQPDTAVMSMPEQRVQSQATNSRTPWLALPPELRNRIYAYTLHPGRTGIPHDQSRALSTNALCPPPLLRTCWQIRYEAAPIYWSGHTFVFNVASNLVEPLLAGTVIDPKPRDRNVMLSGTLGLSRSRMKMLRTLGLRARFTGIMLRMYQTRDIGHARNSLLHPAPYSNSLLDDACLGWIAEFHIRLRGTVWTLGVARPSEH